MTFAVIDSEMKDSKLKEHIEKMIGEKSKETVSEIYHSLEGIKLVQTNNLQFGIDFNDFDDPEECMRLSQEFMKTIIELLPSLFLTELKKGFEKVVNNEVKYAGKQKRVNHKGKSMTLKEKLVDLEILTSYPAFFAK